MSVSSIDNHSLSLHMGSIRSLPLCSAPSVVVVLLLSLAFLSSFSAVDAYSRLSSICPTNTHTHLCVSVFVFCANLTQTHAAPQLCLMVVNSTQPSFPSLQFCV
jgi:hypothetical protein